MWSDRVFLLISNPSTRTTLRVLKTGLLLTCLVFGLTGCLAQKSDLVKMGKDFEGKIGKLDQEKQSLARVLKQAKDDIEQTKQELEEARITLEQQGAELQGDLMKVGAQIKSELRSLREENLPKVMGDLDAHAHRLNETNRRADALKNEVKALTQLGEQRDAERSTQIAALGKSLDTAIKNLEKTLDQRGQTVREQFVRFQGSLVQFKEALAGVHKRLDGTETRAAGAETINAKLASELVELRRIDAAHDKNLEDVTQALTQLRDVLGTTGTQLGTKLDSQGKGLEQTSTQIGRLQSQYQALAKKLDADLNGLRGYLEQDVRPSLASIVQAFDQEKSRMSQELVLLQSGLQRVEQMAASNVAQAQTELKAQAQHVQDLSEAVAVLRQALDSMANMLGDRSDYQTNQLGQLLARMERLDKERSSETEQMSKSLEATAAFSGLQKGLTANVAQLNALTKSVTQLKAVVKAMGDKLGAAVDGHESRIMEMERALKKGK